MTRNDPDQHPDDEANWPRYCIIVHDRAHGSDTEEHTFLRWSPRIPGLYASLSGQYPNPDTHDVYVWDHETQDVATW